MSSSPRQRYLMCPPDYFTVSYVINPWMEGNLGGVSADAAHTQWQRLHDLIKEHAAVELIAPQPGLPDMPFTANAGIIWNDRFVLSRFRHPQRRQEERHFEDWFATNNFEVLKMPAHVPFEGAGDALVDPEGRFLWTGHGHRSTRESQAYLAEWLGLEAVSLRLVDERFYHLDTCLCPLSRGYLLYYPAAFSEDSQELINRRVGEEKRIAVGEEDALGFACNALNIDRLVILNRASEPLRRRLEAAGFEVVQTEMTEFIKAGGAAKCLTLRLR